MIIALSYGQTLQWFLLLTRYKIVSNSYSSSASKIEPTKEFKSSEKKTAFANNSMIMNIR